MIGAYIVIAFVLVIGLSFLGAIHYFWLRDAFKEETTPLDDRRESERGNEFPPVWNESRSKADCQNPQFAIQTSSRSHEANEITANVSTQAAR